MTRKEMFDLSIASDGFRDAVRKALFECSNAAKWLAVGAAIVAAVIVTGQTYPLWFFLIPMIC